MRNSILHLILLICFPLSVSAGSAQPPDNFAGGLMVGSFNSITGKYWIDKRGALDFGVGFASSDTTVLYADYLFHVPNIFGTGSKFTRETSGYLGAGGGVGMWRDSWECGRWGCDRRTSRSGTGVFIRGLAGFEWFAAPTRFGVFGELGPTILFSPASGSGFDVGVGGRFYF